MSDIETSQEAQIARLEEKIQDLEQRLSLKIQQLDRQIQELDAYVGIATGPKSLDYLQ